MARTREPLWWSLFAAGGMVAALFTPVLMVLTGIVVPAGLAGEAPFAYGRVYAAVSHPLGRLLALLLIALPLFHWAHRFRFMLVDMGLRRLQGALTVLCYGTALAATAATVALLWRL